MATDEFSKFSGILSVALSKHHLSGFETVHWDSITSTSFVRSDASFNFMAAVTICSDFGAPKIKSVTVSTGSPSICHEVMGPDVMILVF